MQQQFVQNVIEIGEFSLGQRYDIKFVKRTDLKEEDSLKVKEAYGACGCTVPTVEENGDVSLSYHPNESNTPVSEGHVSPAKVVVTKSVEIEFHGGHREMLYLRGHVII